MAGTSIRVSFCGVACLVSVLTGCTVHRGPDGEAALWSSVSSSRFTPKEPGQLNLAYAKWQHQLGQVKEAREAYQVALKEDPKSVDAVLGLARLEQLSGNSQEAELGFQKAWQMNPSDPHVLHTIGQFYAEQKEWDKSSNFLNQALMKAPGNTAYRYHLAVSLARAGKIQDSMPHFIQTVGEAEAHYNVGYILYEQGKLPQAEQQLLQAVVKRPNLKQAQTMLDDVRNAQRDRSILAGVPAPPVATSGSLGARTSGETVSASPQTAVINFQQEQPVQTPAPWNSQIDGGANQQPATSQYGHSASDESHIEQWDPRIGLY